MNTENFWTLKKPTNIILHGAMLVCLIMFLTSCSSAPEVKQVKLLPPETYLQEVRPAPCESKTNDDLLKCFIQTRKALDRANNDKKKIVEWYKS